MFLLFCCFGKEDDVLWLIIPIVEPSKRLDALTDWVDSDLLLCNANIIAYSIKVRKTWAILHKM